ncbi:MAG: TlpA family protein disulfide reductase [Allomuricauda sp.]
MRKIWMLCIAMAIFNGCKHETQVDVHYVIDKFHESADEVNSVEYRVHRIDTFANGGIVRSQTGVALIEKDKKDKIFGFSFYGKSNEIPMEFIYDAGNGFEVSETDKTYEIRPGQVGFIGTPGGQMINQNIFKLDSIYKNVSLSETDSSYLLTYEFVNDTVYDFSDSFRVYELNKADFLPIKIKQSAKLLGNKNVSIMEFSNIEINNNVTRSIKELKQDFKDYTLIQRENRSPNKLLLKKLPSLKLPHLFDQGKLVEIKTDKLTLLDFWEVWCGPCIASFPKVENLKNKFPTELKIIGIVSEDQENAIKLVEKKGVTFQNLVGNNKLKTRLGVTTWPRYFLVDQDGIVQKEYFGFSGQIEKDIENLLSK